MVYHGNPTAARSQRLTCASLATEIIIIYSDIMGLFAYKLIENGIMVFSNTL